MTYVPRRRPAGVGTGESRIADIAAAELLMNCLTDLGEPVPVWVRLLAAGVVTDNHEDLLVGLENVVQIPPRSGESEQGLTLKHNVILGWPWRSRESNEPSALKNDQEKLLQDTLASLARNLATRTGESGDDVPSTSARTKDNP